MVPLVVHSVVALVHHVVRELGDLGNARVVRLGVIWHLCSPEVMGLKVVAVSSLAWARWGQETGGLGLVKIVRNRLLS